MAVVPNATPLDRALDEAGRLVDAMTSDEVATASRAVCIWEQVFIEAIRAGEPRVAVAAAGERMHFKKILDSLIRAP